MAVIAWMLDNNALKISIPGIYDPTHPLTLWMLARGTPIGYVPVPVPEAVLQALTVFPPNPTRSPRRN